MAGKKWLFDNQELAASIPKSGRHYPRTVSNGCAKSNAEKWIRITDLDSTACEQFPPNPLILNEPIKILIRKIATEMQQAASHCTHPQVAFANSEQLKANSE
jgi:hypothetical protein